MTEPRTATVQRDTKETRIRVAVGLDGTGVSKLSTGIGFFDHMLDQIARHGLVDLEVEAKGDLHIDNLRGENAHHQCETVFKAFARALRSAVERDPRMGETVPSTKGTL
jgi:imidazoleglycerol-phosphate dehydratase